MYNIIFLLLYIQNLISVCHHRVGPFYSFLSPPYPFPPGNHSSVIFFYMFIFVSFGLFIYSGIFYLLVCWFFVFHIWVISYSICLSPSDLFHLAQYTQGPSILLQMASNFTPGHISEKNKSTDVKRYRHPNVHSSIIYNCQDMEAT